LGGPKARSGLWHEAQASRPDGDSRGSANSLSPSSVSAAACWRTSTRDIGLAIAADVATMTSGMASVDSACQHISGDMTPCSRILARAISSDSAQHVRRGGYQHDEFGPFSV